jgi:heme o synthase
MSTTTTTTLTAREASTGLVARLADYVELTKPRIAVLVLVSVAVAAHVGSMHVPWTTLINALVGTTLIAASASAVNQWIERNRDALMDRTSGRPIAAGRIDGRSALLFAGTLLIVGVPYLGLTVNPPAAAWGLLTWILYTCAYTPLKTRTSANTAVGAVAGATPILIGWSAAGRSLDSQGAALFLVLFLWQFPHFMAIAWLYRKQYGRAGMRMLTVVDSSGRRAGVQAVLGALAVMLASLIPILVAPPSYGASRYAVIAFGLGVMQLTCASGFLLARNDWTARWLLRASLIYLPALLILLVCTYS